VSDEKTPIDPEDVERGAVEVTGHTLLEILEAIDDAPEHWTVEYGNCGSHEVWLYHVDFKAAPPEPRPTPPDPVTGPMDERF
jgi:hypothetical protein